MLVSDFMVNSMLTNTQRYFCGIHGMSYWGCIEEKRKKYDTFYTLLGNDDHITTSAKLLDIMCKPYGLGGDLIKIIN